MSDAGAPITDDERAEFLEACPGVVSLNLQTDHCGFRLGLGVKFDDGLVVGFTSIGAGGRFPTSEDRALLLIRAAEKARQLRERMGKVRRS